MTTPDEEWFQVAPGLRTQSFDSSAREPTWVAESQDGRRWQISQATAELLDVLAVHTRVDAIARVLEDRWQVHVPAERLHAYLRDHLVPTGLVRPMNDESAENALPPIPQQASPLLFRVSLLPAPLVRTLVSPFSPLFTPRRFGVGFSLAVTACVWGLALAAWSTESLLSAIGSPAVLGLVLLGTFVHEIGHASACAAGGGAPDDIGFGVYLVFPVLYTGVNSAWALSRKRRIIVDLGGIYLQVLFSLAVLAAGFLVPSFRAVALATLQLTVISVVTSLDPILRLDGYWLLSDALGIPNLRRRSLLMLRQLWDLRHGRRPRATHGGTQPWAASLALIYAIGTVGFFAFLLFKLATAYPHFATQRYPFFAAAQLKAAAFELAGHRTGRALTILATLIGPTAFVVGGPLLVWMSLHRWWNAAARVWQHSRSARATSTRNAKTFP